MTRSKFIPITLATFCGLAVQASGANAQTFTVVPSGAYANYVTPPYFLGDGQELCSPSGVVCLSMEAAGNLVLFDVVDGNIPLWFPNNPLIQEDFLYFQRDGNVVIYAPGPFCNCMVDDDFHTGTTNYNNDPGKFLAVQDDGNLVVYDGNWNPLWAATQQSGYNGNQRNTLMTYCWNTGNCVVGG